MSQKPLALTDSRKAMLSILKSCKGCLWKMQTDYHCKYMILDEFDSGK